MTRDGKWARSEWTPEGDEPSPLAAVVDRWCEGTRYEHEHFVADPTQFVGHVPARDHRAAESLVLAALPALVEFAEWAAYYLSAQDGCRYDHHGYCQSHGLDDKPCPVETVYVLLQRTVPNGRTYGAEQ